MSVKSRANRTGNANRLRRYWSKGTGGAVKIRWGTKGDFKRCQRHLGKYMSPSQTGGYCALRHKQALGVWPGRRR